MVLRIWQDAPASNKIIASALKKPQLEPIG